MFEDRSGSFAAIRDRFAASSTGDFPDMHPVLRILANAVASASIYLSLEHRKAICASASSIHRDCNQECDTTSCFADSGLHLIPMQEVFSLSLYQKFRKQVHGQEARAKQQNQHSMKCAVSRCKRDDKLSKVDLEGAKNEADMIDLKAWVAAGGTSEQFKKWDLNGDGKLDVDEIAKYATEASQQEDSKWHSVCFSSASIVNMDSHSRQVTGVPEDAEYVCFCEGAVSEDGTRLGMRGWKWVSEGKGELDNILRLMLRGGFVYFNKEFEIVGDYYWFVFWFILLVCNDSLQDTWNMGSDTMLVDVAVCSCGLMVGAGVFTAGFVLVGRKVL